ncbi:PQQ-dependent sugar dehydrogenase [Candidatus Saccharibacteria bacterium]|nr:PQQ-dependent sugar dehydrogenase [Candidatus Saccharibacteria bacterium]
MDQQHTPTGRLKRKLAFSAVLLVVALLAAGAAVVVVLLGSPGPRAVKETPQVVKTRDESAPSLSIEKIAAGLSRPWDIAFLPDGTLLYTERGGTISKLEEGEPRVLLAVSDVAARGEGGLMGLAVDTDFEQNNFIFACYASTNQDVRLVRWKFDGTNFTDKTEMITGIPLNPSGRHSGCRPRMDKTGALWVGTGDAANGELPQSPGSLGGKILRVDRYGKALPGNQKLPFDTRIYSFGHRNVQGIALYDEPVNGVAGVSVEHGPARDDEINPLKSGNFGWNPVPGYNESVPMTDLAFYPSAISAFWSSGDPTIAPSGATFLRGEQWKGYEGALAVAVLKGKHLRIQQYDDKQKLSKDETFFKDQFGRLRSAVQGTDGNLYLTTDNGNEDAIIKVTPK